jgi:hypothetical protein
MNRTRVSLALIILLMMAISSLSLLMIKPAFAQTSAPTSFPTTFNQSLMIPEFTIQLADHSYDIPPSTTTTIDQYTGKQIVTTQPGYHVENRTIDFVITNEPHVSVFVPYYYGIGLYYEIRYKGHFGDIWTELHIYDADENLLPVATNSSITLISIPQNYPSDSLLDFQIQAINATIHADYPGITSPFAYWTYESSGWSNIETLSTTDGSVTITPFTNPSPASTATTTPTQTPILTPTQAPTATPTVPEFPVLAVLPFFASALLILVYIKHRRTNHE